MRGARQVGRVRVRAGQRVLRQQRQHGGHAHAARAGLHAEPHALHQPLQRQLAAAPDTRNMPLVTLYDRRT